METVLANYKNFEGRILKSLKNNGIKHRTNASCGLWLGGLMGLCAIITLLREDSSYSEICLIVGVTGCGLLISSICLLIKLSMQNVVVKDFQVIYFLPAITTSVLYLLVANKGLLVSVTWSLTVGSLGTWGVLQLMSYFSGCFTIGEAIIVMHGSILFLISVFTNLPLRYHLPPIHDEDISTVVLQIGLLYAVSTCILCQIFPALHDPKYFYSMIITNLLLVLVPLLYIILDQNPLKWLIFFIFESADRVSMISYWLVCLLVCVIVIMYQINLNKQATSATRKHFHVLATLVYIPGLIFDSSLLYLASGVMMALFILLELLRILKIPPLGDILQHGFNVFGDEKDEFVSMTPLYLLFGLSFPLWMPTNSLTLPQLLSGVLTIGIGDTAASFAGSKWGKHKWPKSQKTIEGTVACIISQLVPICYLIILGYVDRNFLIRGTIAVIGVSLVEGQTDQIDNLVLPLLMYVLLSI